MNEEDKELYIPPMLFFQKPDVGIYGNCDSASAEDSGNDHPLQVVFSSGGQGIGIRENSRRRHGRQDNIGDEVTIASEPENFDIDILERRNIIYALLLIGAINLLVTGIMYHNASTFNPANSLVSSASLSQAEGIPFVFEAVPLERRPIEIRSLTISIIATITGMVSALFESPLGLSACALSIVLHFLLGTTALPYFLFSYKYIFDLWLLYVALLLRSKLVMNFINMRVHRL